MKKQEKFIELYNPIKHNLERFALSISNSYEDAKDLVSDTVLNAYQSFEGLKNEKAFKSFLFTIASRVNYQRIKERIDKRNNYVENELDYLITDEISPDDAFDIQLLHLAINQLNATEKEAIILSAINGFTAREIAKIQQTSIFNVKIRIHRAKKKLQQLLVDDSLMTKITKGTEYENQS